MLFFPCRKLVSLVALFAFVNLGLACCRMTRGQETRWEHLTSAHGDLPTPGASTQQTAALIIDLDGDQVTDFVLGFRQIAPALVGYRRQDGGWKRLVIEPEFLTIEAGGASADIDGDGDLDLVFGADWQGKQLWWWENPGAGRLDEAASWTRRLIKDDGKNQHHDQLFADLLGIGRPQLIFWNQGASTLFLATIPTDPKAEKTWKVTPIHRAERKPGGGPPYVEGLTAADVDGDSRLDLLAANGWLRATGTDTDTDTMAFTAVADYGGRILAARFDESAAQPQVVIAPGDGVGPLMFYQCLGDPSDSRAWKGRKLMDRDLVHGHTLETGDINGDGHLDLFCAEMAEWSGSREEVDHPNATAWLLYGDGEGHFRSGELCRGIDFHEGRLADLDGDGDLDILNKPYTWEAPRVDVWLNNGTQAKPPGR